MSWRSEAMRGRRSSGAAPVTGARALPADVVAHVTAQFPAWAPAHGLCRQCADLYRARSLSVAAAAALPGARAQLVPLRLPG